MKSASASLSVGAFAEPDAGFDYFGTAGHFRHLAGSIVDALSRGSPVLVTGDPAPDLSMIAEALRTAAAPRQVIELPCGPNLDHEKLFGAPATSQESTLDDASDEPAQVAEPAPPVFVLGDADRLSDLQIKDFLEAAQSAAPELQGPEAAVLLARPAFLDRLEGPLLHSLKDGFAAHLNAQHLDRDEVEAFILHQLPTGEQASLFSAQRVALIAVTSSGDPKAVNRLARRMLEIEPGASTGGRQDKRSWSARPLGNRSGAEPRASGDGEEIAQPQTKQRRPWSARPLDERSGAEPRANGDGEEIAQPQTKQRRSWFARPLDKRSGAEPRASGDGEEIAQPQTKQRRPWLARPLDKRSGAEPRASGDGEEIAQSQTKPPRYGAALGLAGIAIGAVALWLVIGAFDSHQLDALIGFVRSRISPPAESNPASAEVPPPAATALPSAVTQTGPSPIAPTAASPTSTADVDAAAERTAPVNAPEAAAPSALAPTAPPTEASRRPPAPEPPTPPSPTPPSPAPPSPALPKAAGPQLSPAETAALVARGDSFLSAGDITSARAFFERAADAGDSQAAMRMAVTFDPAFLDRVGLHGVHSDPEQASFWYQRARNLGGAEPDHSNPETAPSAAPPTR
jgi:hypothetical protein